MSGEKAESKYGLNVAFNLDENIVTTHETSPVDTQFEHGDIRGDQQAIAAKLIAVKDVEASNAGAGSLEKELDRKLIEYAAGKKLTEQVFGVLEDYIQDEDGAKKTLTRENALDGVRYLRDSMEKLRDDYAKDAVAEAPRTVSSLGNGGVYSGVKAPSLKTPASRAAPAASTVSAHAPIARSASSLVPPSVVAALSGSMPGGSSIPSEARPPRLGQPGAANKGSVAMTPEQIEALKARVAAARGGHNSRNSPGHDPLSVEFV